MKRILLILTLFFLIISCTKENSKNIPYSLKGKTSKNLNGKILNLISCKNGEKTVINTDTIHHEIFLLKGNSTITGTYLQFKNSKDSFPILLNDKSIHIELSSENLETAIFSNNKIQEEYISYRSQLKKADSLKYTFIKSYLNSNSKSKIIHVLFDEYRRDTTITFNQFTELFTSLDSLQQISNADISNYIKQQNILIKEKHVADSILQVKIALEKKKNAIPKRSKASLFSAESPNGNYIALDNLIANNKVIIIDFWASWCGPCRTTNPSLVRLYKKYHSKGLEIISVSEDTNRSAWKSAIATDNLTWPQVIDENGRLTFMYSVRAIPHAFVLDKNGGIAAYDIHTGGSKIEKLIIKLLKE